MKIYCPRCKKKEVVPRYNENRWVKWIDILCSCGYNKRMKEDEIDCIQPDSPLWDLVYSNNIFTETEKVKKEKAWAEEKRKEKLDVEYNKKFKNPSDRKFVKDKVLGGQL